MRKKDDRAHCLWWHCHFRAVNLPFATGVPAWDYSRSPHVVPPPRARKDSAVFVSSNADDIDYWIAVLDHGRAIAIVIVADCAWFGWLVG